MLTGTLRPGMAGEAAGLLWRLWSAGHTISRLPGHCAPATAGDGWLIQRELDLLAGPAAGWKIAATSAAGQQHIGSDGPLLGRLYQRCLVESGAVLDAGPLTMRTAEAEFAFVIEHDLDPRTPPSPAEVLAAAGSICPAVEIPDSRYADFTAVGLPSLIADAMCAGFLVLGEPIAMWQDADLTGHRAVMARNGHPASAGTGGAVLGDPRAALAWAVRELHGHGMALRAGDVVTTGACTPPVPFGPSDSLTADFGAFGTVKVRFT